MQKPFSNCDSPRQPGDLHLCASHSDPTPSDPCLVHISLRQVCSLQNSPAPSVGLTQAVTLHPCFAQSRVPGYRRELRQFGIEQRSRHWINKSVNPRPIAKFGLKTYVCDSIYCPADPCTLDSLLHRRRVRGSGAHHRDVSGHNSAEDIC